MKDYNEKARQSKTALVARQQAVDTLKNVKTTPEQYLERVKQTRITGKRIDEAQDAQEKAMPDYADIKFARDKANGAFGTPSDIADTLQTAKNQKAAADYEKNKGMKKGGCVKMARGGGIEIRGKTKGRFV